MPRTDDGEFELIMGNRQLLSVFFLVVFLLGVFFFLGYVVGRSSGPATQPELAKTTRPPLEIPAAGSSTAASGTAAPTDTAAAMPAEPRTTTAEPSPEETKTSPLPLVKKADEPAAKPASDSKVASAAGEPNLVQPEPGSVYVQVAATTRAEAFLVAESVGKKGHPAVVAQIAPNNPTYRVLVGPLPPKDNTAIAKVKGDMEALGFRPFVQKFKDTK